MAKPSFATIRRKIIGRTKATSSRWATGQQRDTTSSGSGCTQKPRMCGNTLCSGQHTGLSFQAWLHTYPSLQRQKKCVRSMGPALGSGPWARPMGRSHAPGPWTGHIFSGTHACICAQRKAAVSGALVALHSSGRQRAGQHHLQSSRPRPTRKHTRLLLSRLLSLRISLS